MNQKTKKALNIVSYVLIGLIFLMAIMVLMINLTSQKAGEPSRLFGASVLIIESDSMKKVAREPDGVDTDIIESDVNFSKGDLIFIRQLKTLEEKSDLKIGDVITFVDWSFGGPGEWAFNTHMIVAIPEGTASGSKVYVTRGVGVDDKGNPIPQNESGNDKHYYDNSDPEFHNTLSASAVVGVYTGKIAGLGAVFKFFKSFVGFGLLIVLPMFAFLAYRIYIVVKLLIAINKEKKEGTTVSEMEAMQAEIERLKAELKGEKADSKGAENSP